MEMLAHYMAQGFVDHTKATECAESDPIETIWVFKPVNVAGITGRDEL